MHARLVDAADQQRRSERPDAAVLGVVLLVVADALHQRVDVYLLAVRYLVDLRHDAREVHEDARVRHEAGRRAADVFVNLENLLYRFGFDEAAGDLLVRHQHDPVLELDTHRSRPAPDGDPGVFHLEEPAVRREDRYRPVVSHLSRLHLYPSESGKRYPLY